MAGSNESLAAKYTSVRSQTVSLCNPLAIEDYLIQPMADASPPKWHLAHVTWFFEVFLLKSNIPDYIPFHPAYEMLFNSYYNGVGEFFPRARRGHLSRPTVAEIMAYRECIDERMLTFLSQDLSEENVFAINLGLHHEQQHQELLLTDLKYNFGNNPLYPAYTDKESDTSSTDCSYNFAPVAGGIYEIGAETPSAQSFVYDNESPRHEVLVGDFEIGNRLVTNGDYQEFIEDEGYNRYELWLSDAWTKINENGGIDSPQYWVKIDGAWHEYTLSGCRPLQSDVPVCHVSGYEADAFARWKNARLPTEQEWEVMAADLPITGNFVESENFHPTPVEEGPAAGGPAAGDPAAGGPAAGGPASQTEMPKQVFGDVWE